MALAAAGMAGTAFGQTPPPGSNVPVPRGLYQPTETIDLWPDGAPGAPAKPLVETVNERSTDAQLTDRAVFGISLGCLAKAGRQELMSACLMRSGRCA